MTKFYMEFSGNVFSCLTHQGRLHIINTNHIIFSTIIIRKREIYEDLYIDFIEFRKN